MGKKIYAYQNRSLVNLPKEKWKDIPGFEGIYKVSSYGRVLSVSRKIQMNSPNGGEYMSKEMIRRLNLEVRINKTVNDRLYTLMISLSKGGIDYTYSVARLVYYSFKEKFDLNDRAIIISCKDGDGRNVHISNLVKSDFSKVLRQSYQNGRATSRLTAFRKPVTQFDANGNPIAIFNSSYEAGWKLGLNDRNILEVSTGKGHMYRGFFWKRGRHTRMLNVDKISRIAGREQIHSSLMKRLGIRKPDRSAPPPFLNLSTKSMRGETWRDVPGYENLYQVSSFGRVKALQKISSGQNRKWMPEQIQKLVFDFRLDQNGNEIPGSAFACMAKNGKKKLVSVPRLVYHLFVKKFDISDTTLRVYYKDNSSLNLHYKNLILRNSAWSINRKLTNRSL